jgi:hypothetical protein
MQMPSRVIFPRLGKPDHRTAMIGDLVQWTSGGVDQFERPTRIRRVETHEGEDWAFVDGTDTAVPVSELTVVTAAADATAPSRPALSGAAASPSTGNEREWLRGSLARDTTYRLIVSGELGPKELGKLITLLQAQKAILEDDAE